MTKFEYEDVREELDGVLSEYGLSEMQRHAFEEMLLVEQDLQSLLDGNMETPDRVFKKLEKKEQVALKSNKLLSALQSNTFCQTFEQLRDDFLEGMKEGQRTPFQKDLQRFERELQEIYFGRILQTNSVQEFLRKHFEQVRDFQFDKLNDLMHIHTVENEPFFSASDMELVMIDIYGKDRWREAERQNIKEEEQRRVQAEKNPNKSLQNLRLNEKMQEFRLRDGVAVGMLKMKDNVGSSTEEVNEMVELLNYNDLDFEYEPFRNEIGELYLIKKIKSFKFNVHKYLQFSEEREEIAKVMCQELSIPFEDFLRFEKGLHCSSVSNAKIIEVEILLSPQFEAEIQYLEEEFFSLNEKELIGGFGKDVIEEEILKFKAHMLFKKRYHLFEMDDMVRVKPNKQTVAPVHGDYTHPDYDLILTD